MENHNHKEVTCSDSKVCLCENSICSGGHASHKRWLIRILVLALVFCFAFHMGVLKGKVDAFYRGMHGSLRGGDMMYRTYDRIMPGSGMMEYGTPPPAAQ